MLYSFNLLTRRLMLPALAIVLGASLYVDRSREMVVDRECRAFTGALVGNDPSATAEMLLCRNGNSYEATLSVRGESGNSVAHLEGRKMCDGSLQLSDMGPLVVEPAEGWSFCFDDVYTLRWNPRTQRLMGTFDSDECNDHGNVVLQVR